MSVSGFLNVHKPAGLTSHDVVARVRRLRDPQGARLDRVGHAGTLDPLATGVLVVCVGAATRLSEYAMASTKRYRARVHLGITTTTYDAQGDVLARCDPAPVTRAAAEAALTAFLGDIRQVPPMFSAIKQGGRKLYDLARAGQTVEREARPVTIHTLALTDWSPPEFTLDVTCSAGTYIRSLAHDLGAALDVGAHLSALTRTASGTFSLDDAVPLDDLLAAPDWARWLIPPDAPLSAWRAVPLDAAQADDVAHGRTLPCDASDGTLARAYAPDGRFLAVLLAQGGRWQPHKVFL